MQVLGGLQDFESAMEDESPVHLLLTDMYVVSKLSSLSQWLP
jgi:hypothetical protein